MLIPTSCHNHRHPKSTPKSIIGKSLQAAMSKLLVAALAFLGCYLFYSIHFSEHRSCLQKPPLLSLHLQQSGHSAVSENLPPISKPDKIHTDDDEPTSLRHVAFGIAASAKYWSHRKAYIKQWWRPSEMRGTVWLDEPVAADESLPKIRVSADTSRFKYGNKDGHRSAIRISRIVAEMANSTAEEIDGVRWFVMGDDDTVFVPENLLSVLRKYDHRGFYYIGSSSESHLQNIHFSYKMAYGGGGFAISAGLAAELAKMQDGCLKRYPELYGSDDRIHACLAELGVPLTKESGFHQFDVYGDVFGILAAHPITPLVTLHHLDVIEPIFPKTDRVQSIRKLSGPMSLDPAGLAQQSICYDTARNWTVSVSWGYAVQVFRGILLPREVEIPGRTFLNWYPKADHVAHAFNTRPYVKNTCQKPFVYFLTDAQPESPDRTLTRYGLNREPKSVCKWKTYDPSRWIRKIEVHKTVDSKMWEKAPRRNCCRIIPTNKKDTLTIDVGTCSAGEIPQL